METRYLKNRNCSCQYINFETKLGSSELSLLFFAVEAEKREMSGKNVLTASPSLILQLLSLNTLSDALYYPGKAQQRSDGIKLICIIYEWISNDVCRSIDWVLKNNNIDGENESWKSAAVQYDYRRR
jgi:hypothetical protein